MKYLIVNGDDFGASRGINRGIIQLISYYQLPRPDSAGARDAFVRESMQSNSRHADEGARALFVINDVTM